MSDYKGIVYTKKWVVDLILDIAGYTDDKPLWKKTIIEPACGQGAFLEEICARLLYTARRDGVANIKQIESCILSYDLDENAVQKSRQIIKQKLMENGISESDASSLVKKWVIKGDYLLCSDAKADFIIGNPPYLRATQIDDKQKEIYIDSLSTMTKGTDLFIGFIQKGLECFIDEKSVLCYICADRWLQNQYGKKLRKFVSESFHIDSIVRMHGVKAFEEDVDAYPAIIRIDHGQGDIKFADCDAFFKEKNTEDILDWLRDPKNQHCNVYTGCLLQQPQGDESIFLSSQDDLDQLGILNNTLPTLEETGVSIGIGLATGRDSVFLINDKSIVEEDRALPVFNMKAWRRKENTDDWWLVNPWTKEGTLVNLNEYPLLKKYFDSHRDELETRHVAKKNANAWYRTIDKINWSILGSPMLLFPDMAMTSDPVYSEGRRYPCHNCYWLQSKIWDIKVLGGLLMSDTAESFIDASCVKMRGGTKRFQAQYLRKIRVPYPDAIDAKTANELKIAFETKDRLLANKAAKKAYEESMVK